MYDWLQEEIAKYDDAEKAKILDLYLRCYTEREIAEIVYGDKENFKTVDNILCKISENGKNTQQIRPDTIQDYNLWEFNVADDEMGEEGFPGRMPGQVVENLLWYYTDPFDLVFDPMAGGGTFAKGGTLLYLKVPLTHQNLIVANGVHTIYRIEIKGGGTMHGKSSTTELITLRLPCDVMDIIRRRAGKSHHGSTSAYIRAQVVFWARLINPHKREERYSFVRDKTRNEEVTKLYLGGQTEAEIGERFGVTMGTISNVLRDYAQDTSGNGLSEALRARHPHLVKAYPHLGKGGCHR